MGDKTELIEQRSEKLEEIRQLGHDPYPHKYELSHTVAELVHEFSKRSGQERLFILECLIRCSNCLSYKSANKQVA